MPRHSPRHHPDDALASFALWVRFGFKQSIENVGELKRANRTGITNPVLTFVVPRAMNYVVERFVLEVVQAWELLNTEQKRRRLRPIGVSHKDYRHLKRIRNKLVAHKIENNLRTARHESWYKRTYGSYEAVLALVQRAAERVAGRVEQLEAKGHIRARRVSAPADPRITSEDISALLHALKQHGIY
jgi:hypothetical protein